MGEMLREARVGFNRWWKHYSHHGVSTDERNKVKNFAALAFEAGYRAARFGARMELKNE